MEEQIETLLTIVQINGWMVAALLGARLGEFIYGFTRRNK